MSALPNCARYSSEFTYRDGDNFVCPERAHDIDCKIDGIGAMSLKSEFVKKV